MPKFKIISGGVQDPKEMERKIESGPTETPGWLSRNVLNPVTRLAGSAGDIKDLIKSPINYIKSQPELSNIIQSSMSPSEKLFLKSSENVAENIPSTESLRSKAEEKIGYKKGSLKPEGNIENLVDMIGQDLPFLAASYLSGGGALLPSLARSAGANIGIMGARGLNLGPLGEIAGSLIGSKLSKTPGKIAGIAKGFGTKAVKQSKRNLLTHMKDVTRNSYTESENLLKGKSADVKPLENVLSKQFDDIAARFDTKENAQALKNFGKVFDDAYNGQLDINLAKKFKQSFSNEARNQSHTPWMKEQYRQASDHMRDWIYSQEESLGKGISDYKRANDLHALVKTQEGFEDLINKSSSLKSILSKSFLKSAFANGLKLTAIKPSSRVYRFFQEPEAKAYLTDLFSALATDQEKEAVLALNKLGKSAIQFEKNDKNNNNEKPKGFKVLSGGRL